MALTILTGRLLFLAILQTSISLASCSKNSRSVPNEITKPAVRSKTRVDIKLNFLSGQPSIDYRAYKVNYDGAEPPYYADSVKIEFPNLTESQFNFLKHHYGFGLSAIKWRPGEMYSLVDFLTPGMQAFNQTSFKWEIGPQGHFFASNCWNIVYEIFRQALGRSASVEIFAANTGVKDLFLNDQIFSILPSFGSLNEIGLRRSDLRFGDILIDHDDEKLYHVGIFVDRDLIFQKANPAEESMTGLYLVNGDFYKPEDLKTISFRRYAFKQLPSPEIVFGGVKINSADPQGDLIEADLLKKKFQIKYDNMGRSALGDQLD